MMLQIIADAESGELRAALLTTNATHDADVADELLVQVAQPAACVSADGAYNRANVYTAIETHSQDAPINIPPRRDAKIHQHGNSRRPPLKRDENLRSIRQ